MDRAVITFVVALTLSATAWAGNWNSSSSTQKKLQTQNSIAALSGFGVNSMALWSGVSRTDPNDEADFLAHYKTLETFGVKHIVLVSCADWVINLRCKKPWQNINGVVQAAKLILDNTNLHVVIQLKAYKQEKVNGKKISDLNMALEKNDDAAVAFADSWKSIALQLQSYPPQQLSFNLLNEPEFEIPNPSSSKRDKWLSIAKKTVSGIRSVSPDRTVILEGIGKSLFADRKKNGDYLYSSPDELLKPIDLDNIIYAFHNYEPVEFLQQANYRYGSYGREYSEKHSKMVFSDAQRAIKWANRHKVSVMLTETGCIGYLKGKEGPKSNNDCGLFAEDIQENYIDRGIGVTWWALEKEKTIYDRDCPDNCWMPLRGLRPNTAIFNAFKLKLPEFEPVPLPRIKNIDEFLKYDEDFESCVRNEAETLGIAKAKIDKTIRKAKNGREKHIRKIKDLIVGGGCL